MPLTETHLLGTVDIPSRSANSHRDHWIKKIHDIEMAGPKLLAMMNQVGTRNTPSTIYHWAEQPKMDRSVTFIDVYLDAGFNNAYVSGGVSGDILYFSCTTANAKKCTEFCTLSVFTSTTNMLRNFQVLSSYIGSDTTSYVAAKLLQADTSNRLAEATPTALISSAHPELADTAVSLFSEQYEWQSNIQRFQSSWTLSEAEIKELETWDPSVLARQEKQALQRLHQDEQFAYLLSRSYTDSTSMGRLWHCDGLIPVMEDNESGNVYDAQSYSAYSGQTVEQYGISLLEEIAEVVSRTREDDVKTVVCSGMAMKNLQSAVRDRVNYNFKGGENKYGLKVSTLEMPGCAWDFVVDPAFSQYSQLRNTLIVYEPHLWEKMTFMPLKYDADPNMNPSVRKGNWSLYSGIRWNNLEATAVVKNYGLTNTA